MQDKIKKHINNLLAGLSDKVEGDRFITFVNNVVKTNENELIEYMQDKEPLDCFLFATQEKYQTIIDDIDEHILSSVKSDNIISELLKNGELSENDLLYYIIEHTETSLPWDDILQQEVAIQVTLDTGDANHDFSVNTPILGYHGTDDIEESSAVLWLTRQQGYSKRNLKNALYKKGCDYSMFLESLVDEIDNASGESNAMVFLLRMTIEDYWSLIDTIDNESSLNCSIDATERRGEGYLIIDKDAVCGLIEPYFGAEGMLSVLLERDVKLPIRYIASVCPYTGTIDTGERSVVKKIIKHNMGRTESWIKNTN